MSKFGVMLARFQPVHLGHLALIEKACLENDWTDDNSLYPMVKEGVVVKRSTLMKGQRRPQVKIKTKWWLDTLKSKYINWQELE